ncbi:S-adenosyl-L-methionine-dependent methyltransferase [Gloeophyllum trabeum ATCC 11539]|uniref:S-adenosyl-L-methionine-dependent methyltransferase n=1 Tax=Gloeophyllum trabeum (strain ATCC 11539 / FP-39264 / Madison 617) TaxID=670483 RepID=S7QEJ7_GLOTA|nr:S-adenosyl-L-methionine-dependent methyltransferase [Gloeophyllum trabeum ATCC 11539]EPQ57857.1 S-adenosyl-L-methionine-dependent methyltransferase [Gloeophyllum trabeum ATCC 11539]
MSQTVEPAWEREDKYHASFLTQPDEALDFAVRNSDANELDPIAVTALQGKYLNLQARTIGAKRILELGTLGGYSAIWLARALPDDGELITCEYEPKHARVAGENIAHAGLASKVKILVGPAADSLAKMDPANKFDFAFIDADKAGNPVYLEYCKKLVRKGGVIVSSAGWVLRGVRAVADGRQIVDNTVRQGRVSDMSFQDENSKGVRKMLEDLKNSTEFEATTLQTVGEKAWDGFTYVLRV